MSSSTQDNENTVQCPNCAYQFSIPAQSSATFTCNNHGCNETFTRSYGKKRHMMYSCPIKQDASEEDVRRCPFKKCDRQHSFRPDKLITHLEQVHNFGELPSGPGQHVFPTSTTPVPQVEDSEMTDTAEETWTPEPTLARGSAAPPPHPLVYQQPTSQPSHDRYHRDHTQPLPYSSAHTAPVMSNFPLTAPFQHRFDPTPTISHPGSNIAAGSAFVPDSVRERWNNSGSAGPSFSSPNQDTYEGRSIPMTRTLGYQSGYQNPLDNQPPNRGGDSHGPQSHRSSSNNTKRPGRGK